MKPPNASHANAQSFFGRCMYLIDGVGRRLTINPLLILLALSFWAWVWGTTGALLAVPLLIILKTILDAAGKPDIAGFLFEEGTLTGGYHEEAGEDEKAVDNKR